MRLSKELESAISRHDYDKIQELIFQKDHLVFTDNSTAQKKRYHIRGILLKAAAASGRVDLLKKYSRLALGHWRQILETAVEFNHFEVVKHVIFNARKDITFFSYEMEGLLDIMKAKGNFELMRQCLQLCRPAASGSGQEFLIGLRSRTDRILEAIEDGHEEYLKSLVNFSHPSLLPFDSLAMFIEEVAVKEVSIGEKTSLEEAIFDNYHGTKEQYAAAFIDAIEMLVHHGFLAAIFFLECVVLKRPDFSSLQSVQALKSMPPVVSADTRGPGSSQLFRAVPGSSGSGSGGGSEAGQPRGIPSANARDSSEAGQSRGMSFSSTQQ